MTEWAHSRTGMDISPGTEIGSHFFIDHGTGVVIGETSKIGSHVKLYQGVALIARSLSAGQALHGQKRHPSIEDNVTVYSGAQSWQAMSSARAVPSVPTSDSVAFHRVRWFTTIKGGFIPRQRQSRGATGGGLDDLIGWGFLRRKGFGLSCRP